MKSNYHIDIKDCTSKYEILKVAHDIINKEMAANQELFLAKILAMNPAIDLKDYRLCTSQHFGHIGTEYVFDSGMITRRWWLEKIT